MSGSTPACGECRCEQDWMSTHNKNTNTKDLENDGNIKRSTQYDINGDNNLKQYEAVGRSNKPDDNPKTESRAIEDGQQQSPIDINTLEVIENMDAPIYINYPLDIAENLTNTGHGWKIQCNGRKTEFYGGPLENKFRLEQFHCHWGSNVGIGSEHLIDGKSYSGELHFVHWNAEKYDSFEEASHQKDGLAVLAVFLDIGKVNSELLKITALLPRTRNEADQVVLTDLVTLDLEKLLPIKRNYWTYFGSLTTPPFNETVTWIILEEPIKISEQQLNVFRSLKEVPRDNLKNEIDSSHDSHNIKQNFREPQSINNRVIRKYTGSENIIEK